MQSKSLKKWREERGLTQQQMADALDVHVQYVSAIECGRRRPGMRVALKIRDHTGGEVTLDALTGNLASSDRQAA